MRSNQVKKGIERAPHRALLKATGVTDADMGKPFIAIVNSYIDIVPGHVHLQAFGKLIKDAVRAAGGVPFEFNTIGVDDGIAMGHAGMKYISYRVPPSLFDRPKRQAKAEGRTVSENAREALTRYLAS